MHHRKTITKPDKPYYGTITTFCDDRLRGLGVTMGRISRFPIDLRRRPYNSLALPCECVIIISSLVVVAGSWTLGEQGGLLQLGPGRSGRKSSLPVAVRFERRRSTRVFGEEIRPNKNSPENTCHTWALLRWWITKRRYIKCTYLYLYIHLGEHVFSDLGFADDVPLLTLHRELHSVWFKVPERIQYQLCVLACRTPRPVPLRAAPADI